MSDTATVVRAPKPSACPKKVCPRGGNAFLMLAVLVFSVVLMYLLTRLMGVQRELILLRSKCEQPATVEMDVGVVAEVVRSQMRGVAAEMENRMMECKRQMMAQSCASPEVEDAPDSEEESLDALDEMDDADVIDLANSFASVQLPEEEPEKEEEQVVEVVEEEKTPPPRRSKRSRKSE